ncbi:MAG: VCBS repeat-containing protein [Planctomycetes bacterium]|nr:VCBS repeat-containing protein [Planctomycetota bacterium]
MRVLRAIFADADATRFPDQYDENLIIRNYAVSGDIDADGDVDLFVLPHEFMGSQGSLVGSPALFVNQGGAQGGFVGEFVEEVGFWLPGTTFVAGGALVVDLDNDGDLDMIGTSVGGVIQSNKVQDGLLLNQLF